MNYGDFVCGLWVQRNDVILGRLGDGDDMIGFSDALTLNLDFIGIGTSKVERPHFWQHNVDGQHGRRFGDFARGKIRRMEDARSWEGCWEG